MSSLLINEPPLQVLPSLANAIGLNEAIVLQQLHYLLSFSQTQHAGKNWIYNSFENWQEQYFTFWSVETVKRTFNNLRKIDLILCEKLQKQQRNQTNFYTINYDKLSILSNEIGAKKQQKTEFKMTQSTKSNCANPLGQNDTMTLGQNDTMTLGQNDTMLQENTNRIPIEDIQESNTQPSKQNAKTKKEPQTKKFLTADNLVNLGVDEQVASDFIATRKTKLTQTALNGIIKQAKLAKITLPQAIEFTCEMGWQSFKAEWYFNAVNKNQNQQQGYAQQRQIIPQGNRLDFASGVFGLKPQQQQQQQQPYIDGELA